MADVAGENTFSGTSSGDESDGQIGASKKTGTYDDSDLSSQYSYGDEYGDESGETGDEEVGKGAFSFL